MNGPNGEVMRLRCPKATTATFAGHLAINVLYPIGLKTLGKLATTAWTTCACGGALVILAEGEPEFWETSADAIARQVAR